MQTNMDNKKVTVKVLIGKFYQQLTNGCGEQNCDTPLCASNKEFNLKLTKSEAAAKALDLVKSRAVLCKFLELSQRGTNNAVVFNNTTVFRHDSSTEPQIFQDQPLILSEKLTSPANKIAKFASINLMPTDEIQKGLNQTEISKLYHDYKNGISTKFKDRLFNAFSSLDILSVSFIPNDNDMEIDYSNNTDVNNEDEEVDKEIGFRIDIEAIRNTYDLLFDSNNSDLSFMTSIINGLDQLNSSLTRMLSLKRINSMQTAQIAHTLVVIMELPFMLEPIWLENGLKNICKIIPNLPMSVFIRLARFYSLTEPSKRLKNLIDTLQQFITIKVLNSERNFSEDLSVQGAVQFMKCYYYASLLGGCKDDAELIMSELRANNFESTVSGFAAAKVTRQSIFKVDPISEKLNIKPIDCRRPLIDYTYFINELVSDTLRLENDYIEYKQNKFSFFNHSFMLTTAAKVTQMFFENKMAMTMERRQALFSTLFQSVPVMPYLKLNVRRTHIVEDALVALEASAMDDPSELRKQLYIEFEGEQGLDEGGLSKEFFQLICVELFNPDYGMFIYHENTRTHFFNASSFENDAQFTLVGIVLGLAIYNNVILDIRFPSVVYRKLMGKLGTFEDLADIYPTISSSLQQLLEYEGNVEEDFLLSFTISYDDLMQIAPTVELKPNGKDINVTKENRAEFVKLYTDFLLNKRIEKQFSAFRRGFKLVTDESPLEHLFRPDEVELLICGSQDFNFEELESSTQYDGGYEHDSITIRHFWELIHKEFNDEHKKQLLQFTTGSDRVPIGGLSKLKLIIAKNGLNSDRLPTAHTCFNVLLIPDYQNKDKLRDRLLKAIVHTKGFGML